MSNFLGRYRPVQGLLQCYAVFSGTRGLINGPIPGEALEKIINGQPTWVAYSFFGSLLLGGLVSVVGELIQLRCPLGNSDDPPTLEQLGYLVSGQIVERAGDFLIGINYLAYAVACVISPDVLDSRSYPYFAIGLGFLGRCGQLMLNHYRLTVRRVPHDDRR